MAHDVRRFIIIAVDPPGYLTCRPHFILIYLHACHIACGFAVIAPQLSVQSLFALTQTSAQNLFCMTHNFAVLSLKYFLARNTASSVADAANNTMFKLNNWFLANKLSLNTDKTCYMVSARYIQLQQGLCQ